MVQAFLAFLLLQLCRTNSHSGPAVPVFPYLLLLAVHYSQALWSSFWKKTWGMACALVKHIFFSQSLCKSIATACAFLSFFCGGWSSCLFSFSFSSLVFLTGLSPNEKRKQKQFFLQRWSLHVKILASTLLNWVKFPVFPSIVQNLAAPRFPWGSFLLVPCFPFDLHYVVHYACLVTDIWTLCHGCKTMRILIEIPK